MGEVGSEGDQLPTGNEEIVTEFKREKWEVKEISYLREMRRL